QISGACFSGSSDSHEWHSDAKLPAAITYCPLVRTRSCGKSPLRRHRALRRSLSAAFCIASPFSNSRSTVSLPPGRLFKLSLVCSAFFRAAVDARLAPVIDLFGTPKFDCANGLYWRRKVRLPAYKVSCPHGSVDTIGNIHNSQSTHDTFYIANR